MASTPPPLDADSRDCDGDGLVFKLKSFASVGRPVWVNSGLDRNDTVMAATCQKLIRHTKKAGPALLTRYVCQVINLRQRLLPRTFA